MNKNAINGSSQRLDLTCAVAAIGFLAGVRRAENAGRVACRLSMLVVLLNRDSVFALAARMHGCDRRTVSMWYCRVRECDGTVAGIRRALSDMPRTGRPTKIDRGVLEEAEGWCRGRPFTPSELRDRLEELSGVRLSLQQARRYARRWGYSRKKTQAGMVNRASLNAVRCWRGRLLRRVAGYRRRGYAVATMDESHFADGVLSARFWTGIGVRIIMLWSGGHHRFSMLCTMTMDGGVFFNHCRRVNEDSFLEHLERVHREVGRMVLVLDKAPWHTSDRARKFFREHDIAVIWYPTGHPYLNPVEEVWSVLKRAVDYSVRHADRQSHLDAVYRFVTDEHEFDYDFLKFWKRRPPGGLMRPFVRTEPDQDTGPFSTD